MDEPQEPALEPQGPRPRHRLRKGLIITGSVVGVLVLAVVVFLALFDWNYLRGPIARYASAQTQRPIRIDGNLRVKLLSRTPNATIEGLKIGNPNGTVGDLADVQKLAVSVKLSRLLRGEVILPYLQVDQPTIVLLRDAKGLNNWTFKGKSPGEPTRLPAIRRFEINAGKIRVDDKKRKMTLTGTVSSSEVVDARRVEGFRLRGDGTMNGEPFKLVLTGGPLLNVDPKRPYPFDADVRSGATTILAKGAINKPFDLGVFSTSLTASGPDMADIYELTGITLPNTPPYKMAGQLTRHGTRFDYTGINGRVGDSDLHGKVAVDKVKGRVMLTGDLNSRSLDFNDLAAVLGGAPSIKRGQTASAKQVAIAHTMAAKGMLLPDAKLQVDRLRNMDAAVKYRADTVKSERFPVRRAAVDLKLDRGLLSLNNMVFGLANGQLAGHAAINARQDMPIVDVDVRLTGARIEQFLPAQFAGNAVQGSLIGRAKLSGRGRSVHEAASAANGTVTLVVPHGEIRKAFAELMGVNVVKGLGLLLTKNQDKTDIRCGIADFQAKGGTLYANRILIDTGPVLAQGGGTIDLRTERMNLRVKGDPKEFRLVRLMLPIKLEGPLTAPKLGVEAGPAVGQLGLAAAIGSVLAPLAAILPFVDDGLAKNADCQGLIAQAGKPQAVQNQVAQGGKPTPAPPKAGGKG